MNAVSPIRTTIQCNDDDAEQVAILLLDRTIGEVMDKMGDMMGALYAPRRPLSASDRTEAERMREALVLLAKARNVLAPMMVVRL